MRGGFSGGGRGRGGPSRGMSRGGRGMRGDRGGRGGRGGFRGPLGPPSAIIVAGEVVHSCESQLLIKSLLNQQVPYFNGRVFLENKQEIGKVDEILGPINEFYFSVKLEAGMKAESFNSTATKFYIDQQQVLPLSRFLPKPAAIKGDKSDATKRLGDGQKHSSSRGGGMRGGRGSFSSFGRGGAPRGKFGAPSVGGGGGRLSSLRGR